MAKFEEVDGLLADLALSSPLLSEAAPLVADSTLIPAGVEKDDGGWRQSATLQREDLVAASGVSDHVPEIAITAPEVAIAAPELALVAA